MGKVRSENDLAEDDDDFSNVYNEHNNHETKIKITLYYDI